MMLVPPLISFDRITRGDLNRCLVAWQHKARRAVEEAREVDKLKAGNA